MKNLSSSEAEFSVINADNSDGLQLKAGSNSGIFIKQGGIGIGTQNPVYPLDLVGIFRVSSGQSWFRQDSTTSTIYAQQYGSGPVGIFLGGDVGIGTANPDSKLHVVGDLHVSGKIFQSGNIFEGGGGAGASTPTYNTLNVTGSTQIGQSLTVSGDTFIDGDLTVKGDSFVIETETLRIEDKNIELGTTSTGTATDVTADGGGIALHGDTLKTIAFDNSTKSWISSENFGTANGKHLFTDSLFARDSDGLRLTDDAGSLGIFIADGGHVGIGNSNPNAPLDIESTSDNMIQLNQGAGAPWNYLSFSQENILKGIVGSIGSDDETLSGALSLTAYNGENLTFRTSAGVSAEAARMTILNSNGNVGIGTANPDSKLHVVGDLHVSGKIFQSGNIFEGGGAGGSGLWSLANSQNIYYTGGNVGIGTTDPYGNQCKLDVYSSLGDSCVHVRNAAQELRIDQNSIRSYTNNDLSFFSSGNQGQLYLKKDGKVGVGTTTPNANLDVVGNNNVAGSEGYIKISNNTHGDAGYIGYAPALVNGSNSQQLAIRSAASGIVFSVGSNEKMRVDSNGNVGIGTTNPDGQLHVQFTTGAYAILDYASKGYGGTTSNEVAFTYGNKLHLGAVNSSSNPQVTMSLLKDGKVGIGTVSPAQQLDVYGNIAVNGSTVHTSDDRIKHNEQLITGALSVLDKVTPKKYIKTLDMYEADHNFDLDENGLPIDVSGNLVEHNIEAGVLAQEILTIPELAFAVTPERIGESGVVAGPHGLDYNSLFVYSIAAIKEQQNLIDELRLKNNNLESIVSGLNNDLQSIISGSSN